MHKENHSIVFYVCLYERNVIIYIFLYAWLCGYANLAAFGFLPECFLDVLVVYRTLNKGDMTP